MAVNSEKVVNMARNLAIVHIIVGSLLICFGIADRAVEYFWTGYGGFGIWIGIWVSCLRPEYMDRIFHSKSALIHIDKTGAVLKQTSATLRCRNCFNADKRGMKQ